jgi:hypothetical protein
MSRREMFTVVKVTTLTQAIVDADSGMRVVDGLMSFASDGRGKPTESQRSLYLAAVAFSYAVWENFIEDLAIELTDRLAIAIDPARVPDAARKAIEKNAQPWELAVHPGWRGLWVERVRGLAKGSDEPGQWGINSASKDQVDNLFKVVGIDPVPERIDAPIPRTQRKEPPAGVSLNADGTLDVKRALRGLIAVRGEAVHTAKTSNPLFKAEVFWWGDFVRGLYRATNTAGEEQCGRLLATT